MHFLQAINSDISVLIVCNKTGGTIKGDIKKEFFWIPSSPWRYWLLSDFGTTVPNVSLSKEWRRLQYEELYGLHSSSNTLRVIKSRRMRWTGHVAHTGERRGAYRIVVRRPEGKRQLVRSRQRWEGNIKMDHQEVGWGVEWTDLAHDRDRWWALVNSVMKLRIP